MTATIIERHNRSQCHTQKLLGPMEIPRCEERHTRAPLEIRRRTMKRAQIIHPRSRVNDVLTELHGGPSRGHLGVNVTVDRCGKGTTGSRQETMLRNGAGSATSVQPVAAS
jgi:hypothetical protein